MTARYRAAGGVVIDGDRVLVIRHLRRGELRLPKGHVDDGEEDVAAACREVTEETGYTDLAVERDLGHQLVDFDRDDRHVARDEHYFRMRLGSDRTVEHEPAFEPHWLPVADALTQLTFAAEREWVRRAVDAADR